MIDQQGRTIVPPDLEALAQPNTAHSPVAGPSKESPEDLDVIYEAAVILTRLAGTLGERRRGLQCRRAALHAISKQPVDTHDGFDHH